MTEEISKIGELQRILSKVDHPVFKYSVELTADDFFVFKINMKCTCNTIDVDPVSVKSNLITKANSKNFVLNIVETLGKRLAKDSLNFNDK